MFNQYYIWFLLCNIISIFVIINTKVKYTYFDIVKTQCATVVNINKNTTSNLNVHNARYTENIVNHELIFLSYESEHLKTVKHPTIDDVLMIKQSYRLKDTYTFKTNIECEHAKCTLNYYYENGSLKSTEIYIDETIGLLREYSRNGILVQECIFPIYDSLYFNSAKSGDIYVEYQITINDSAIFMGNQWYENGHRKLVCINPGIDSIVYFQYFDTCENLRLSGAFKYLCSEQHYCFWKEIGEWKWYDEKLSIIDQKIFSKQPD